MFHHTWIIPPEEIGKWTVLYVVKANSKARKLKLNDKDF